MSAVMNKVSYDGVRHKTTTVCEGLMIDLQDVKDILQNTGGFSV